MNQLSRGGPAVEPRLWRSSERRMLAGVVGGLAERMSIDVTLARVLYTGFTVFSGIVPGIVLYGLLWYIAPVRGDR